MSLHEQGYGRTANALRCGTHSRRGGHSQGYTAHPRPAPGRCASRKSTRRFRAS